VQNNITSIRVVGLHGQFDLVQDFQPGVNVLHGENGAGKTTLLHILTNLLNSKYARFAFLDFDLIEAKFDDDTNVTIVRENIENDFQIRVYTDNFQVDFSVKEAKLVGRSLDLLHSTDKVDLRAQEFLDKFENMKAPIPAAYFPAFRTMIEAWTSSLSRETNTPRKLSDMVYSDIRTAVDARYYRTMKLGQSSNATKFARDLFGDFVPAINYPSPMDIEISLEREFEKALYTVARVDQELLSQTFLDTFAVLSKGTVQVKERPEEILSEIRTLIGKLETFPYGTNDTLNNKIYKNLLTQIDVPVIETHHWENIASPILDIYREKLKRRYDTQEKAFEEIKKYLNAVNDFLNGKEISIFANDQAFTRPKVGIKFDNGTTTRLQALSSGERQIITMTYAASQMSSQKIVLIDEPEISLHIDWQRRLLRKLSEQIQDRQIIVCTHSPVIAADYRSRRKELKLNFTQKSSPQVLEQLNSEEDVLF